MKNKFLLPWARLIRSLFQYRYAVIRSRFGSDLKIQQSPILFVIACGRSGTTILGKILEAHPDVYYFFEPWHLWAAVDPYLDLTNLHTSKEVSAILDETFFSTDAQVRFNRLFYRSFPHGDERKILVEKTPHNALRIGYLEKLVPSAYYVHIVRDGFEVAESINKLATANSSKIATKPNLNQWWGNRGSKWEALKRDGVRIGYQADELDRLISNRQRGAYEWLLSLREVEKHRAALGQRLLEIKFDDLVTQTGSILERIVNRFDLKPDSQWLANASKMIRPKRSNNKAFEPLILPPRICEEFNDYQRKYGFHHRATSEGMVG
jgi:hypothetical protein